MTDPKSTELSWDNARQEVPARPQLPSSVADTENLPRPKRTAWALILVLSAALTAIILMVIAALRLEDLTDSLVGALPQDVVGEYSDAEIALSAEIGLAVMGGGLALLLFILAMNVRSLMVRRSRPARISYVIMLCLYLPVAGLSLAILDAAPIVFAVAGGHAAALLAALFLMCTPRVNRWLNQEEKQRIISL